MTTNDPVDPAARPADEEPTIGLDAIDSSDASDSAARPDRSLRARRGLTAAGVALALVLAGAAGGYLARGGGPDELAVAAGSTSSPSADDDSDEDDPDDWGPLERFRERAGERGMLRGPHHGFGPGFGPGFGMGPGLVPRVLHGTFVVPDGDGGHRTVLVQHGEVTDVTATSVTLRSEDGYSATYELTDDTVWFGGADGVDDVEEGDRLGVSGARSGGTTRALHVMDLSRFEDMLERKVPGPTGSPSPTLEDGTDGEGASSGV
jgi:hypothetical protein